MRYWNFLTSDDLTSGWFYWMIKRPGRQNQCPACSCSSVNSEDSVVLISLWFLSVGEMCQTLATGKSIYDLNHAWAYYFPPPLFSYLPPVSQSCGEKKRPLPSTGNSLPVSPRKSFRGFQIAPVVSHYSCELCTFFSSSQYCLQVPSSRKFVPGALLKPPASTSSFLLKTIFSCGEPQYLLWRNPLSGVLLLPAITQFTSRRFEEATVWKPAVCNSENRWVILDTLSKLSYSLLSYGTAASTSRVVSAMEIRCWENPQQCFAFELRWEDLLKHAAGTSRNIARSSKTRCEDLLKHSAGTRSVLQEVLTAFFGGLLLDRVESRRG